MKRSTNRREVLGRKVLKHLLLAATPLAPAPHQAAAMKQRVMDAVRKEGTAGGDSYVTVRSDTDNYVTVPSYAGVWMDFLPRVQVKVLHSDGRYHSILLRMEPGASLPAHFHEDDEECVVLEGEARLGDIRVKAGDYHLAQSGSRHGEVRSETGAILFLRTTKEFSRRAGP